MYSDRAPSDKQAEVALALKSLERHGTASRDFAVTFFIFVVLIAVGAAIIGRDLLPPDNPFRGMPFLGLSLFFSASLTFLIIARVRSADPAESDNCADFLRRTDLAKELHVGRMPILPPRELAFLPSRQKPDTELGGGFIAVSEALGQLMGRPDEIRTTLLWRSVFSLMLILMGAAVVGLIVASPLRSGHVDLAQRIRDWACFVGAIGLQFFALIYIPGAWRQHIYAEQLAKCLFARLGVEADT